MAVAVCVVAAGARATPRARGAAVEGEGLYLAYCAACHGATGRGDGPDAPLFMPRPRNLRDGLLERYETADLVRSVRNGAALSLALDPKALGARADEVEAIVAHMQRLPDVSWDLVWRGEEVFASQCTRCHGPFGQPHPLLRTDTVKTPRDLTDPSFQRSVDERALAETVRHGRKGMPAIPAVRTAEDLRALATFVRLLSPGYVLYGRYCASCHGEDGRGGDVVDPGAKPAVLFDRAYFASHDGEQLRARAWHMLARQRPAMPHFRTRLDQGQVTAIIRFLRRGE
jgi:mono/diheme cytochrome c family protein